MLRFSLFTTKYGVESITKKGELVKSRSEKYIADYFYDNQINYIYEKPFEKGFWIFKNELAKPDFYLPDYDVYVEYWGLIDNKDYFQLMRFKMRSYHEEGLKFISIYPDNLKNFNYYFRKKFNQVTGKILKTTYYPWKD